MFSLKKVMSLSILIVVLVSLTFGIANAQDSDIEVASIGGVTLYDSDQDVSENGFWVYLETWLTEPIENLGEDEFVSVVVRLEYEGQLGGFIGCPPYWQGGTMDQAIYDDLGNQIGSYGAGCDSEGRLYFSHSGFDYNPGRPEFLIWIPADTLPWGRYRFTPYIEAGMNLSSRIRGQGAEHKLHAALNIMGTQIEDNKLKVVIYSQD